MAATLLVTTSGGIRVDTESIERLLEDGLDVLVEFAPDGVLSPASSDVVSRAMETAASEVGELDVAGPVATVAGFSMELRLVEDIEDVVAWFTVFGRVVGSEGMTGTVRPTTLVRLPQWFARLTEPRLTVFAAYGQPFVDRAASWVAGFGGDLYVGSEGLNQRAAGGDIASYLYQALRHGFTGEAHALDPGAERATSVGFSRNGQAAFQLYDSSTTLAAQADRLRDLAVGDAERTRLAFVAVTSQRAYGDWESRADAPPALPTIGARQLTANLPLWERFVPDVHGMQVLTREHLDNATDLSRWTVTEAGSGRYLVEAPDLAEWFQPGGPEAVVLARARARADFGRMIVPDDAFG